MPNLVGTGLNQVPTNSMLGGMAYQDPKHTSIKNLDVKNLSQINSEIAATAIDIFVYDTSKDSDGGAWRKRTQHTSWYNEPLNTSTRGSRKEFPAVAVIVSTLTDVTIYDGDDPDLPMWMVFNAGASGFNNSVLLQYGNYNGYHPAALNGILVIGEDTNGDNWGSPVINFISEYIVRIDPHSTEGGIFNGRVGQRNDPVGFNSPGEIIIVNSKIQDVAMTVLPNAPTDKISGLPTPTIAIATAEGVSVIKDNGTVVDIKETAGSAHVEKITFRKDNKLGFFTSGTANKDGYPQPYYIDIPSSDISVNYFYNITQGNIEKYGGTAWESNSVDRLLLHNEGTTPQHSDLVDIVDTRDNTYAATNQGLNAIIRPEVFGTPNSGRADMRTAAVAYIQNDYNTGYMPGDIRGAYLSDTNDADISYSSVADDWATAGAWTKQSNITITSTGSGTSGTLSITGANSGSNVYFLNSITVEQNTHYVVSITFGNYSANSFWINNSTYSGSGVLIDIGSQSGNIRGGHFYSGSNTTLYIQGWQFTTTATTITNITVQKATAKDRAKFNRGPLVQGTITTSAVAPGADLVAYNSSSGNTGYFQRQLNQSDISLTSTWSMFFWVKKRELDGSGGEYTGIQIAEMDLSSNSAYNKIPFSIYFRKAAGDIGLRGAGVTGIQISDPFVTINVWHCMCITFDGSSTLKIYIDGVEKDSTSATFSNPSNPYSLQIMSWSYGSAYYKNDNYDFSLFRLSQTVPSTKQIKRIYEDEKYLFQENAKATLYGSSDDIKALAYDDTTNLVHVGTSAGRSDFQGLCRINNTTTAVTTAISASNGLVAEQ